jgi:cytochrome c553
MWTLGTETNIGSRPSRHPGLLLWLTFLALPCQAAPTRPPAPVEAGENIYLHGVLSTGEPLAGERAPMPGAQGSAAACTNCHRRSGLGEVEGRTLIPPLTARYLYRPRSENRPGDLEDASLATAEPGARAELLPQVERSAYTDATLARAIREGVGPDGRRFDPLMPRFRISDSDMASLIAYLKQLSSRPSPGVGDATLQFATIIAPDADPVKRRGMLSVLEHFFGKANVFSGSNGPPPQLSGRFIRGTHRWQLHVWELAGAPNTWEAQLDERLKRDPVFAAISGIGGSTWEPVHRFCQRSGVPCLFPNVDLPVVAERDSYDVYWSKGVLLEAQLIAKRLRSSADSGGAASAQWQRLIQLYRRGDIGEGAAAELRAAAGSRKAETVDRALDPTDDPSRLQEALSDIQPGDVLVLWLRPDDIGALPPHPPAAAAVFVSGIMAGLEHTPLTPDWRTAARITYPFELPQRRLMSMDFALGWMHFKQIPVVDERTQADTYLACVVAAETVEMIGEDLVRDHLLEMLEMHLGARIVNGYYPRLGLSAAERFASKGGYLVRFADAQGGRLLADGDWSVP